MTVKRRAEAIWIESRNRWQINVQRDGMRKTFISSLPGKKGKHDAEAKADKWLQTFATDQRFSDAIQIYYADKQKSVQATTFASFKGIFDKWVVSQFPAAKKLSAITPYDWQCIIDNMAKQGSRESSIKLLVAHIRTFINYCICRRWDIEELREGQLKVPESAGKAKAKTALNSEQLEALLSLDPLLPQNKYVDFFKLAVLTGLRKGELLGLKWSDINKENSTLNIQRNIAIDNTEHKGKTKNSARIVPLQREAMLLLQAHRERTSHLNNEQGFIFCDEETGLPMHYANVQVRWAVISRYINAGTVSIHELRHTFISIVKDEMPEVLLKQIVGHSASMDTIGVYGHQTAKDITTATDIVDTTFSKFKRVP